MKVPLYSTIAALLAGLTSAMNSALTYSGVNAAYISNTSADPSLAAPDGTIGAKFTGSYFTRLQKSGAAGAGSWLPIGGRLAQLDSNGFVASVPPATSQWEDIIRRGFDILGARQAIKIVAHGDSITYSQLGGSAGTQSANPWPARLQDIMQSRMHNELITVVNRGVPGENTTVGLTRVATIIANDAPDAVIISYNDNDNRNPMSVFVTNMRAMIRQYRAAGVALALATLPPMFANNGQPGANRAFNAYIRRIGLTEDVPVFDIEGAYQSTMENLGVYSATYAPDGVHPGTDMAYAVLAHCIADGMPWPWVVRRVDPTVTESWVRGRHAVAGANWYPTGTTAFSDSAGGFQFPNGYALTEADHLAMRFPNNNCRLVFTGLGAMSVDQRASVRFHILSRSPLNLTPLIGINGSVTPGNPANDADRGYWLTYVDSVLTLWFQKSGGVGTVTANVARADGREYRLEIRRAGANITGWVDGVQQLAIVVGTANAGGTPLDVPAGYPYLGAQGQAGRFVHYSTFNARNS